MAVGGFSSGGISQLQGIVGRPPKGMIRAVGVAQVGLGINIPGNPVFEQDVVGFSMTEERLVVDGLPAGALVPADVLTQIAAAKRVDAWIDRGRQVQAWADEQGAPDASLHDEETGALRLPPELAGLPLPAFVSWWLAEAEDIEQLLAVLCP